MERELKEKLKEKDAIIRDLQERLVDKENDNRGMRSELDMLRTILNMQQHKETPRKRLRQMGISAEPSAFKSAQYQPSKINKPAL